MSAMYLPLDEREAIKPVEHPDVVRTAGSVGQWSRAGTAAHSRRAPMPALGEGQACVYCEARGFVPPRSRVDGGGDRMSVDC
jgi:ATP-dependent helicase/nuclease subunit B